MRIIQGLNYENKSKSFTEFFVNSCGRIKDIDVDTKTQRPRGREDYQLLLIKKGPFYVTLEDEEIAIEDDTVIIFHPGEPQIYHCKKDEGAEYFWIHFDGEFAKKILKCCGMYDKKYFQAVLKERYAEIIERMVFEITHKAMGYEVKLMSLFGELVSSIACSIVSDRDKNYKKISPALKCIEQNTDALYSVSDYAKMCNMSSSHFMHKFKEITGQTLMQYKNEVLMKKAGYMIENTELSISEISFTLGIDDSMYFSKKFKAFFGVAPSDYRKDRERK